MLAYGAPRGASTCGPEASRTAFCLAALSNPLPRDLIACHALLCPFRLHLPAPVFALPFLFLSSLTPPTIFFSSCLTLTTKESRKTKQKISLYWTKSLIVIFDFDSPCFPKKRDSSRPTGIYPNCFDDPRRTLRRPRLVGEESPSQQFVRSPQRLDQHHRFFASQFFNRALGSQSPQCRASCL